MIQEHPAGNWAVNFGVIK
uniref:Uncharacterized protein n=1 Tax=Arundo donax TaxID=35708 RepID=A0A0A9A2U6_ARUDO